MDRRWIGGVAWAIGGLLVALALTFGAFAIAGSDLSEPATTPVLSISPSPPAQSGGGPSASPSESPSASATSSPSEGPDDHGGSSEGSGSSEGDGHGDD